jgi:hypothetical protein
MKMLEKMIVLFCAAVLAGFFFHLGQKEVGAAPLPNCPTVDCLDVYAWTTNTTPNAADIWSAQADMAGTIMSTQAIPVIYTPKVGANLPLVPSGNFYRWKWFLSTLTCAQINNANPVPQEVTLPPDAGGNLDGLRSQNSCTPGQAVGGD